MDYDNGRISDSDEVWDDTMVEFPDNENKQYDS